MAVPASSPPVCFSLPLRRPRRPGGRRRGDHCRRRRHVDETRVVGLCGPASARRGGASLPRPCRPEPQPPCRAGVRGRGSARPAAAPGRGARRRLAHPARDPRPLPVVHPDVQHRELHAQRSRSLARRRRIGQDGDLRFAVSGVAAAVVFVSVNHLLLAFILRLGRGHSIRETGLFSASSLGIELAIAGLGIAVGTFALDNPWLIPAVIAPLALAHRSLSTTAQLRETRRTLQNDVRVGADGHDAFRGSAGRS